MGEHTFGLAAQLVAASRAVTHLSIWFADMPEGYASGLEYDPDHSTILLDRSYDDARLADELRYQVDALLAADRANSRLMLRAATELESGPNCGHSAGGVPMQRRAAAPPTPGAQTVPRASRPPERPAGCPTDVP